MNDQVSWEWKLVVGAGTMLFNGFTIAWIMLWGNPNNPILQNIVADSYLLSSLVLVGLGVVPQVVDSIVSYLKK